MKPAREHRIGGWGGGGWRRARLKIWLAMKSKRKWRMGGDGEKMEKKEDDGNLKFIY